MSWPDIAREVLRSDLRDTMSPHIEAALARVQYAAQRAQHSDFSGWTGDVSVAAKPMKLRTFADTPRENSELGAQAAWVGNRFALNLETTVVASPDDHQTFRLDGSFLGVALGNTIISAGSMDRWWGPGWEGSIILSSNSRPIPAVGIERNYSDPFESRFLRWLGSWRAGVWIGELDHGDVPVPDVRFAAARVTIRPVSWLEIGLSRTAQWCGRDRTCDFDTFVDLLAGQDNVRGTNRAGEEPGNQMAGYDFRLRSPWRAAPVALYGQLIGEDEAGGTPSRLLGLFGLESWAESAWGAMRFHVEYADTACNFSRHHPLYNCAYQNDIYPQGYTYQGREIAHALGGDGQMMSLGALLVRSTTESWSALARKIKLNRDADPNALTSSPNLTSSALNNVELQYNHAFAGGMVMLGLGFDDYVQPAFKGFESRAFLCWRQSF
jgi:hypothetical protein